LGRAEGDLAGFTSPPPPDYAVTAQSEPGDVAEPVTPVDLDLGLGNTSTSGCEPEDFTGLPDGNTSPARAGSCS